VLKSRCEFPDDKFLQDIAEGTLTNPDQGVLKDQLRCIAIACRIIRIGDAAGCEASENPRVIRLPAFIVALANQGTGKRV